MEIERRFEYSFLLNHKSTTMLKLNWLLATLFPMTMFAQTAQTDVEKDIFEEQRKASEAFSQKKSANINQGFYISPKSVGVFSFDAEFEQDYFVPGVRVSSWPNPFFEKIDIQIEVKEQETCVLELTDSEGYKVLPVQKFDLAPGIHNIACDAGHLKDGNYILNVRKPDSKGSVQVRISKRD